MIKLNPFMSYLTGVERKRIVTEDNVVLRLNRGERPFPLAPEVRAALAKVYADQIGLTQQYPSYQAFYEKYAASLGVPSENICVGAGIEEFIRVLMWLHTTQHVAVLWPTCKMYEVYAEAFLVHLTRVAPVPDKPFTMNEFVAALHAETKMVFVPNPGQPVETHFTVVQLRLLAHWCAQRDILLVVDEAHYGFGAHTALPLLSEFTNIIVMRTFSKYYGAASLRVGCAIGSKQLMQVLHAVRPSGEIAGPSLAVASRILDFKEQFENDAFAMVMGRDWLRDRINTELAEAGLRAWGRWGFSVLIEFPSAYDAVVVGGQLEAHHGIYTKFDFPEPVHGCMLVACGSVEMMKQFYLALKHVYLEHKDFMGGSNVDSGG